MRRGEESIRRRLDRARIHLRAGRQALAQRLEDVAARERRHPPRQSRRRCELREDPLPLRIVERRSVHAAEQPLDTPVIEAELDRSGAPVRDQLIDRELALLGLPGRERRGLGRARARRAALGERRLDLRAPAAERPQHRLRDADQIGDPVPRPAATPARAFGSARRAARPGRRSSPPARARTAADHQAPTTGRPGRGRGWRPEHGCAAADRPPVRCDAETRPPPTPPAGTTSAPPWPRRTAAAERSR